MPWRGALAGKIALAVLLPNNIVLGCLVTFIGQVFYYFVCLCA